ncbi:MAG TPA: ribonuclease P protein component [Chthoniobacterales bacterium]|jgi:ribonuclease P protein component
MSREILSLAFPAKRRLKLARQFKQVRSEGKTVRGALLTLGTLRVDGEEAFRVGFVTARRIGGAVVRNRARRRLREVVRRRQHDLLPGFWIVVIARPAAAAADWEMLEREWLKLARRAGILSESDV